MKKVRMVYSNKIIGFFIVLFFTLSSAADAVYNDFDFYVKMVDEIKNKRIENRFIINELQPQRSSQKVPLFLQLTQLEDPPNSIYIRFNRGRLVLAFSTVPSPEVEQRIDNKIEDKAILLFEGRIQLYGYTFISEGENGLAFTAIEKMGWVYLHGKGKVILKNGKEVKLGY